MSLEYLARAVASLPEQLQAPALENARWPGKSYAVERSLAIVPSPKGSPCGCGCGQLATGPAKPGAPAYKRGHASRRPESRNAQRRRMRGLSRKERRQRAQQAGAANKSRRKSPAHTEKLYGSLTLLAPMGRLWWKEVDTRIPLRRYLQPTRPRPGPDRKTLAPADPLTLLALAAEVQADTEGKGRKAAARAIGEAHAWPITQRSRMAGKLNRFAAALDQHADQVAAWTLQAIDRSGRSDHRFALVFFAETADRLALAWIRARLKPEMAQVECLTPYRLLRRWASARKDRGAFADAAIKVAAAPIYKCGIVWLSARRVRLVVARGTVQAGPEEVELREISAELWRWLRHQALDRDLTIGACVAEIIEEARRRARIHPDTDKS